MSEPAGVAERPSWAARIRAERTARKWTQADAVRALEAHSTTRLPERESLLRNWKRWEAGERKPDEFYQQLVAKTFGTVSGAIFPVEPKARSSTPYEPGVDTLDLVERLRVSDVSSATLDALRINAERLACAYPHAPSEQLHADGQAWFTRTTALLDRRLTLRQHRDILNHAGWTALVLGCVEYDMGRRPASEATRQAVLSLAKEAGNAEVMAWAYEMRAWFALTQGDYRAAIAAADSGQAIAPHSGAAVQLAAQKAKAWARIGDRRQVEVALDRGRALLEALPHPENLDNHFVVDPAKFDFYAMDCLRVVQDDRLAEVAAHEVIRSSTGFDGSERKPMRAAEARITLGVLAARNGDLEHAVALGQQALAGERKSLPSLQMVASELGSVLAQRYPGEAQAAAYVDQLRSLTAA